MKDKFIPQMEPLFGAEEANALYEYMNEGGFLTEFKRTTQFENMIAEFTGAKHCIVVNNGTVSLTVAGLALGLKPGDEVIVPNYTMIATANAFRMIGCSPVFVDVHPETLTIKLEDVEQAVTKKTKAFVLVSANGREPKEGIERFIQFSKDKNIHLIEDAAQSLGSYYSNRVHAGCSGIVGSFSFSAPKIISTGQGGALITNSDELASHIRRIKDFGRSSGGVDKHETIGYNFKFTELQACVGIEQMKKLNARIVRKKEIWLKYYEYLHGISEIKLYDHNINLCTPWFIDAIVSDRPGLVSYLFDNGIGTRVMYPPITNQPAYGLGGTFPNAEYVGRNGLWLPSAIQIKDEEIERICNSIGAYYKT